MTRAMIRTEITTLVFTPDRLVGVSIPERALPQDVSGSIVEIELEALGHTVPAALPENTTLIRTIELNTMVGGAQKGFRFTQPVEITFLLEPESVEAVNGDFSRLRVLRFGSVQDGWQPVPVRYVPISQSPGRLVATVNEFSMFALALLTRPHKQENLVIPTPTATPEPTPSPIPTPVPSVTPVPTASGVQRAVPTELSSPTPSNRLRTPTPVPATPTPTLRPTRTSTPAPQDQAPAIAGLAESTITPVPTLLVISEPEAGGLNEDLIVIIVLSGLGVFLGAFGLVQTIRERRR
jgi:hypothetical protein